MGFLSGVEVADVMLAFDSWTADSVPCAKVLPGELRAGDVFRWYRSDLAVGLLGWCVVTGFPASKDDTLWCPDPIRHGSFQPPVSWSRLVVADSPRPEDRRLEHRCGLCGMLISSADADLMRGVLW